MGTSRFALLCLVLMAGAAHTREAASPAACQAASQQPAIVNARAAVAREPEDLRSNFSLADAWSEAGCFNEAAQVLQAADDLNPGNAQLQTRLRVARSLVGEEHFFDNIDRAEVAAKLKRNTFRCTTLADLEACTEADRLAPGDPAIVTAHGDALLRAERPAESLALYRRAVALAPNQRDLPGKIAAAEAQVARASIQASAPAPAPAQSQAQTQVQAAAKPARAAVKVRVASRYTNESGDEAQSH